MAWMVNLRQMNFSRGITMFGRSLHYAIEEYVDMLTPKADPPVM